ncbi:uncharacterized protein SPPG_00475 [Spizellomyces punctatus DAOM BR117]|uniref:NmrA-like domain-containing protein n=1 Tax=Spizellomyces punctatus (strain DAOM BR117) TaxID=645134 RepID=A0A0L0HUK4_SPIPD|nr:uncharacterized protein SPPG_00475 [Spizellomyces punctatus DAOM BR117]KND04772.1 hypothetical protein SPPG_00475 [Spizellomyces punctatus DAOM BR117]|eukprot:XP_016612811.1 hypothetical protein SPPG_00475 [Spizellomyces punctatus DAOM BR117]
MSSKKLLVVFGATGAQGGSVVRSILSDPKTAAEFSVRAVTRDTSKPSAQALSKLGAETIKADLKDKASLRSALKGAYAVFSVTNYWEEQSAEAEIQQGKNVADVAKELNVQHFIWSSLLNVTKLSGGKLDKVFHFDSKAEVEEYIRSIGIPATFFLAGFYMSNLSSGMFRPDPDTKAYTLAFPVPASAPVPLLDAAADTGKFVKGILLHREKTLGKRIFGATEYYTLERIVEEFKAVKPEAGKTAKFVQVSPSVYKEKIAYTGAPDFVQEEMLQNMQLLEEFGYYGNASLDESHSIVNEPLTTWKEFAAKTPDWADLK